MAATRSKAAQPSEQSEAVKKTKKTAAKKPAVSAKTVKAEKGEKTVKSGSPAKKTAPKLVIVESPAKAKAIGRFLGKGYKVEASNGHIRDLPKSQMGIDVENGFEPKYITIRGRGDVLAQIRKDAKEASAVILATDPDREGEAISWHLATILDIDPKSLCRVEFNEITEKTVKSAIKTPRSINMELVDAQQARRVLDRLVGYKISPLLWRKIRKGLSAGRVQSVTTRMIIDREDEIEAFIPEEYWYVDAHMEKGKQRFDARVALIDGEKAAVSTAGQAETVRSAAEKAEWTVSAVRRATRHRHPAPPFTTSVLQQEAGRKLGFTTAKTMQVAQQLYEGVDIKGKGTMGLISYIRTDSVRLSDEAVSAVRAYIGETYGAEYLPQNPNVFKGRRNAQDAHEAIRPTNIGISPESVRDALTRDQYRLYKLVYQRFVACQTADAVYETVTAEMTDAEQHLTLRTNGSRLVFKGFTAIYEESSDEEAADEELQSSQLPELNEGESVRSASVTASQHFTEPPARYTEASLVRALEEKGIGRPSTYAPTISTIVSRGYVTREKRNLYATELGRMINDMMTVHFPEIVDVAFTAGMEEQLDEVEDGSMNWQDVISRFYGPFSATLEKADASIEKVEIRDEESDVVCDKCGAKMVYKLGRFGKFLACPNFPDCRNTKNILVSVGVPCPKCGGELIEKNTKRGRKFYGCEHYPECDFTSWDKPSSVPCPDCGAMMTERRGAGGSLVLTCTAEGCGKKMTVAAPEENEE